LILLAVDIGGTFTDLMGIDAGSGAVFHGESLTTPQNLSHCVLDCVRKSGVALETVDRLVHGSTIAINTLIERKGARTALVVTWGTRDVYPIGRGNRPQAFNLNDRPPRPLVARQDVFKIDQRTLASGEALWPLVRAEVEEVAGRLKQGGFDAVAVCFLHSYADTRPEQAAGAILGAALDDVYISKSHDIMREYREYAGLACRSASATWLKERKWNLARSRKRTCPPWGMWGGRPGETAEYVLRLPANAAFQPIDQVMRKVLAGSEVIVLTGGGWGPPEQRDPAAVLEDVRQGVVSADAAESDYGVVIRDLELDRAATEKRRAEQRGRS
jgi:hypothetical protein